MDTYVGAIKLGVYGGGEATMETPYGTAEISLSGNAESLKVVKRGSDRFRLDYELKNGEWKRTLDVRGNWSMNLKPKFRARIRIVIDELLNKWLKDHKTDLARLQVASMRERAWTAARDANWRIDMAHQQRDRADKAEREAFGLTEIVETLHHEAQHLKAVK
jgi:hypothetical protein